MPSVFFYISGHGFGHASRQIEVINAFGTLDAPRRRSRRPERESTDGATPIAIRTSAARWLFDRAVRVPFTFLDEPVDTGVVQIDSLRLDDAGTVAQADEFHAGLIERAATEAAILHQYDARLVVADAPALGCAAAAAAGVPSFVCANFTWDWIYQGYGAPADLILRIQEAYAKAEAAWRLPLHGGFESFVQIEDVPFIARHARRDRDDVRNALHLPVDTPLALVSFGAFGVRDLNVAAIDCLDRMGVIFVGSAAEVPPARAGISLVDETRLYGSGPRYEDLVAAVDVVVTKPGYGIVSECIANDTAILYTSRGRFLEYDVMVREMPRYARCRYLPQEDLLAGRWLEGLEGLLAQPAPPERPATTGADVVAGLIAGVVNR